MKTININEERNPSQLKFKKRLENYIEQIGKKDLLYIRTSDIIYCLKRQNISYLQAQGNYTEIYTNSGSKILSSKTLKYFQGILNSQPFARIHQSFLINLNHVCQVQLKGRQPTILMHDGSKLPISRSKQSSILSLFQN